MKFATPLFVSTQPSIPLKHSHGNYHDSLLKRTGRPQPLANHPGLFFREPGGEQSKPRVFGLASEIDRAIDLSRRACGAMAMGAGLGFPIGDPASLRFHSYIYIYIYEQAEAK